MQALPRRGGVAALFALFQSRFSRSIGPTTLTYKDSGLATKTTYSYIVKTWQDCNGNGVFDAVVDIESVASNTASATTP